MLCPIIGLLLSAVDRMRHQICVCNAMVAQRVWHDLLGLIAEPAQ